MSLILTDLCCMTYKTTSKRCFSKLSRFLCNEIVNFSKLSRFLCNEIVNFSKLSRFLCNEIVNFSKSSKQLFKWLIGSNF